MANNKAHCESIAQDLNDIAEGDIYIVHGELRHYDTLSEEERELIEDGEIEEATMADYFEDTYDLKYIVDSDKEYLHCRVCVACGGPNIWIDTEEEKVKLYWWADYAEAPISEKAAEAMDAFFRDLYSC